MARQFPRTPIVLNHTGFPGDRSEEGLAFWRRGVEVLAPQGGVGALPAARLVVHAHHVGHQHVVVGAGVGGLNSIHHLLQQGKTVRAFDAGSEVGGTWYWNKYPGARVDIESL